MVDFIITDFESVRGGGNIVDSVPSTGDFVVDGCTVSSSSEGVFVLTPSASDVGSVSLTVSSASVTVGGTVTLTATVLDSEDNPLEDIGVSFRAGSSVIGSDTTDSSGVASYTATMSSAGTFSMTAVAGGVTSTAQSVTVNKITSTISLSSSSASASYGTSITLSGTLSVGSGASVKLYKEAVLVDTLTTGTGGAFSYSTSSLPVSSHSFTAVYDGDSTHTNVTSSAVSVTITKITSTISLSAVSSTITVGDSPQLTGTLSVGSGKSVKIYLSNTLVDTVTTGTNGAFSFTGSATSTSGSLTFKAVYDGDSTHSSVTSSNVVITVSGSTPVMDSISLTEASSKTILSAYDSDTASLTATVLDSDSSGMSGVTVTFKKNGTSIGTATTNSNGVATKSYSADGSGDISFTAECSDGSSTFVSETYSIEDCYAYATSFSNWSSVTNKGTAYKFSPFVLPTNHRIEFKLKSTSGIRLACGDSTHTNNSGYLEWIYAWFTDKLYYRNSSNTELNVNSGLSSANTSSVYALEYNGTTITLYRDSTVLKTQTGYDPLTLTRYLRYHESNLGSVAYFKIKAL